MRIAGTYVPMTAVLGAIGTFAVWCVIMYYKPVSGVVGLAWVAVGLVVYVIFRKVQGYSLTKTVKSPTLPASLQEDVVYDQLLVPVRDTQVSDEMMVLACQLATERKSSIDALYVIEVPLNLPIDASLPEERERARQVLERTMSAADQFKVKVTPIVVTARSAGRAIVEEAIARRSEVIVLGSQGKRRIADKVFGRTIDYVLNNLPCEAIINVIPKHTVAGGVGVRAGASIVTPAVGGRAGRSDKAEPAAVNEAAEAAEGGSERLKRRAQGLRLGRYVSSRPAAGEPPPGLAEESGGDGSPARPQDEAPVDDATRDSGAT